MDVCTSGAITDVSEVLLIIYVIVGNNLLPIRSCMHLTPVYYDMRGVRAGRVVPTK